MSNQGLRQASVRAVTGTSGSYEGDWHALFDQIGIPAGDYNGRLLAWINAQLSTSYTELNGAMAAYGNAQGVSGWTGLGTFAASSVFIPVTGAAPNTVYTSNPIVPTGYGASATISIAGGINAGYCILPNPFTSATGTITAGTSVRVQCTSGASAGTTTATLTIGALTFPFSITV